MKREGPEFGPEAPAEGPLRPREGNISKAKTKVAFYWCPSCGGWEESIVDLAEDILKVVATVDIFQPYIDNPAFSQ